MKFVYNEHTKKKKLVKIRVIRGKKPFGSGLSRLGVAHYEQKRRTVRCAFSIFPVSAAGLQSGEGVSFSGQKIS
jgi:hypothetical protein